MLGTRNVAILVTVGTLFLMGASESMRCPAGAEIVGDPPPKGTVQWCQKRDPDGLPVFHGPWLNWNANGALVEVGRYESGKKHGRWQYLSKSGTILVIVGHERGKIIWQEDYRGGEYWRMEPAPGQSQCVAPLLSVQADIGQGRSASGCIQITDLMFIKDGIWEFRSPSRTLRARGDYHNDQRQGPWEYWDEEGRPVGVEELRWRDRIIIPDPK